MCTLVIAARVVPEHSLVVVANRDEQLGRPSTPPFRWSSGFIAPRDDLAGGTWLGLNDRGVFVGITNRFSGPRDPTRTSRGAIVIDALSEDCARAIHTKMARLEPARYNGFHLVYADEHDVLATVSDGHTALQLSLGNGVTIVTERSFGASGDEHRVARIRAGWSRLVTERREGPREENLTTLLSEHDDEDPLGATCIHLDQLNYGTRSAMVLAIGSEDSGRGPSRSRKMLWAEGPPCTTAFHPIDLS